MTHPQTRPYRRQIEQSPTLRYQHGAAAIGTAPNPTGKMVVPATRPVMATAPTLAAGELPAVRSDYVPPAPERPRLGRRRRSSNLAWHLLAAGVVLIATGLAFGLGVLAGTGR